jgi:hypothetical protein
MSNEDSDLIAKLKEAITRSPDSGGTTKQWDRWFDVSTLDRDLRRKLSFHDLRRLGAHAVSAFAPEQESSAEGRDGTTASSPLHSPTTPERNAARSEHPLDARTLEAAAASEMLSRAPARRWPT